MEKDIQKQGQSIFEQIKKNDEHGNEFWTARTLAKALDYNDFRNFLAVIEKAKEACINSGQPIENHLVEFNEMVLLVQALKGSYRAINYLGTLVI